MVSDRALPTQGGLPPVDRVGASVVEIACDESGFSGTNLLDAGTPVFTHASVDLDVDEATELVRSLRSGFSWSRHEFKSGHFLRGSRAGEATEWLLAALHGRAHVHLIDKEFFLVTRVVDLFLGEPSYAAGTSLTRDQRPAALALHLGGRAAGREWGAFLEAFVSLVRTRGRQHPDRSLARRFFQARDALLAAGLEDDAAQVLGGLGWTRVWGVVTRMARDDRSIPPPLEPLLPALAETVLFWSGGRRQVLVVHDEQSALTASRLTRLQEALAPAAGPTPLAGLVTVDSRDDPRIQVADLLAGIARRSSGRVDPDPVKPFVSAFSLRVPGR